MLLNGVLMYKMTTRRKQYKTLLTIEETTLYRLLQSIKTQLSNEIVGHHIRIIFIIYKLKDFALKKCSFFAQLTFVNKQFYLWTSIHTCLDIG